MKILEKILEEIKQYTKDVYECDLDDIVEYQRRNREDKCTYIVQGIEEATEFIRSHMDEAKDINVPSNDDMEEKIREHIAECLHRIDNIRSFIGSKEYTSNDEKCIRNIEVLKTIITALEEYLSSKKKNGNDDWIPVEERLPEEPKYIEDSYIVQTEDIITPFSAYWDGKEWTDVNDELLEGIIAWYPLPKQYKTKEIRI